MVFPLSEHEAEQLQARIDADLARVREGEGSVAKQTEAVLAKSWLIARERAAADGRQMPADPAPGALQILSSERIRAGLLRAASDAGETGGLMSEVVERLDRFGEDCPFDRIARAAMRGPGGGPPQTDPRSKLKP